MKDYTDLPQSKKLSEFLSLESADMEFMFLKKDNSMISNVPFIKDGYEEPDCSYNIVPCWSLAALLDILESEIDGEKGETYQLNIEKDGTWWNIWYREQYDEANPIETKSTEDLIDACVEMIIKLNEQKIL